MLASSWNKEVAHSARAAQCISSSQSGSLTEVRFTLFATAPVFIVSRRGIVSVWPNFGKPFTLRARLTSLILIGERKDFEVYSCDVSPDGKRLVTAAGGKLPGCLDV